MRNSKNLRAEVIELLTESKKKYIGKRDVIFRGVDKTPLEQLLDANSEIKTLDLSSVPPSDLSSFNNLFIYRQFEGGAGKSLALHFTLTLRNNTTLESLNLSGNTVFLGSYLKSLTAALVNNKTLKSLDLSNSFLWTEHEAVHVADLLKQNKTLRSINISKNHFRGYIGVTKIVAALEENFNVTSLEYDRENWGGYEKRVEQILQRNQALVANETQLKSAESINLAGAFLRDRGASFVSEALRQNDNLKSLDLSNNNIGNDGAQSIAAYLRGNSSLVSLDLSANNRISSKGAGAIIEALQVNDQLTSFSYGDNISLAKHKDTINQILKQNELKKVTAEHLNRYRTMESTEQQRSLGKLSAGTIKEYNSDFLASILQKEYRFLAKVLRFFLPTTKLKQKLDSSIVRRYVSKQIAQGGSDDLNYIIKMAAAEDMLSQPLGSVFTAEQLLQGAAQEQGNPSPSPAVDNEPSEELRPVVYPDSPLMTKRSEQATQPESSSELQQNNDKASPATRMDHSK